ncbi:uncharacterized protein LOC110826215 [Carica papaya]|uniref:uncharacterized protein LOC110826215 n=1 Tax=Carica papaya TaxID=3649 RepID=UPI000B8CBBFE|nr:uncharacterized protein LOC110826215 [Carica papaya]
MHLHRLLPSWIRHLVSCMGGCLGCCNKPPIVISVDEPSKGLKIQGKSVKKASVSEDFWSSSACEIDNSTVQSQRSISLMSTSDLPLDPCSSAGTSSNPVEFVNHGLLQWNQTRQQWLAHRRPQKPTKVREPTIRQFFLS